MRAYLLEHQIPEDESWWTLCRLGKIIMFIEHCVVAWAQRKLAWKRRQLVRWKEWEMHASFVSFACFTIVTSCSFYSNAPWLLIRILPGICWRFAWSVEMVSAEFLKSFCLDQNKICLVCVRLIGAACLDKVRVICHGYLRLSIFGRLCQRYSRRVSQCLAELISKANFWIQALFD